MKKTIAIITSLLIALTMSSQSGSLFLGISSLAIDDNAKSTIVLNEESLMYLAIPTKLSAIRIFPSDFFVRMDGGYLKLNEKNYGERYRAPGDMFCFDLLAGYKIKLKKEKHRFDRKKNFLSSFSIDGSGVAGLGYTYKTLYPIEFSNAYTLNIGGNLTFNFLSNRLGVNFQSLAKFGINRDFPKHGTNYLDFSIGIFYKVLDYNKNEISAKILRREKGKKQKE